LKLVPATRILPSDWSATLNPASVVGADGGGDLAAVAETGIETAVGGVAHTSAKS
jgi:hypothetical protein